MLYVSFPPRHLWFLAPVAIAILVVTLRGRSPRAASGYGYLAGLGFFVPLLPWVGTYVGAVPWLALAAAEAVAFGVFGALAAVVGRCRGAPLWLACAWMAVEAARSRVPFGGFPWGRIAFGQPDGLLLPLAALAGAPGLSFVVVLLGTLLAAVAAAVVNLHPRALAGPAAAVAAVGLLMWMLVPSQTAVPAEQSVTVALVQGNVPRLGLDFNAQRRAVLDNHVQRTLDLAEKVRTRRVVRPDVVVWPENSSDIDPFGNRDAAAQIDRAARAIGVPILVGAVVTGNNNTARNTMVVWDPVSGPGQEHDKRQLVPFGEYLPMRNLMIRLSSYAAQAGNFVPGTGKGVVDLAGVPVAVATCYEVAFDDLVAESVRAGAQLIAVPTNNATFGRTEMTYQQLAMSRVRAVEHDRAVVIAATSGVSAVIKPDGDVAQQTALFTPDVLIARVPLKTTTTIATRAGAAGEGICAAVVLAVLVVRTWTSRPRT
ncbi:Apolipoprotein N-acyltransferase [Gordonia bronchialis]|nr:apolipoprotein N-acyltransferase [Gordonia bronchialis]MCC3324646.1 apolipoprotein N-acyltransferase [Gordonia bronchialis]QGS26993.1 apolipoprotein N-acyltransferase [Gordonia bronchialis]STQ64754.1 Apolipoprotein N-acyltransferase [Gordonia bronchialis]